jgi:hypothetical protein
MRYITPAVLAAFALSLAGCGTNMPQSPDGDRFITVVVADTSGMIPGSTPGVPYLLEGAEVSLDSRSHQYQDVTETDEHGVATFENVVAGSYAIFTRAQHDLVSHKIFTGFTDVRIESEQLVCDTILVSPILDSDLMINEIFYAGSDRSTFYFYDQYVELYNASSDTLYLDGCILTRQSQTRWPDQEEVDFVRAIYAFQFPGTPLTGRQYPIAPKEFVVVAADAINHSQYCPKSIDLSNADWEFFNALGHDYDNVAVPNLESIHPTSTIDFLINLSHNGVVLATGEDYFYEEYVNDYGQFRTNVAIPISTIIDGIEYASHTSVTKELTVRVDAGFAGLGCTKYSGQSAERRELGLDSNNSTFDFLLAPHATPGYSYFE